MTALTSSILTVFAKSNISRFVLLLRLRLEQRYAVLYHAYDISMPALKLDARVAVFVVNSHDYMQRLVRSEPFDLAESFSRSCRANRTCSRSTGCKTSSLSSASPPTMPITHAESTLFIPSVLGTDTLLTFLSTLPETSMTARSGIAPKTQRALADTNAIAIGSVQPSAGTSSFSSSFIK